MSSFTSAAEFREVIDRTFAIMRDDPKMGPSLREAGVRQQFEFTDLGLAVNLRAGDEGEKDLVWDWSDEVAGEPRVKLAMDSDVANRFFRGQENIAIAIARRRIKAGGDVRAALVILTITKPLYARYREMVAADYPHLDA